MAIVSKINMNTSIAWLFPITIFKWRHEKFLVIWSTCALQSVIGYRMQLNIAKFSCNFRSLYVTINVKRESLVLLVGFLPVKVCILFQQITNIVCHSGQKRE